MGKETRQQKINFKRQLHARWHALLTDTRNFELFSGKQNKRRNTETMPLSKKTKGLFPKANEKRSF